MRKLLVNNPQGDQEIIEVGEGGGYFDESLVIWDEDKDGALPAVTLNGMKRSGKKLVIDPAKLASYARKPVLSPKIDLNSLTEAEKQSLINLVRSR